jgi:hypothetical protein
MNYSLIIIFLLISIFILLFIRQIKFVLPPSIVKFLVKQTARWSVASTQDQNAIVRLLHANYAVGYLDALQQISRPDEIEYHTGINYDYFVKKILENQSLATQNMVNQCPNLKPKDMYLATIAEEA